MRLLRPARQCSRRRSPEKRPVLLKIFAADAKDSSRSVLRKAQVEVGLDDGARVEILSGLVGTEKVVVRSSVVSRAGDPVVAVPASEP